MSVTKSKLQINMYWQGPLSVYEQACLASFIKQGFAVDLYSFEDLDPPAGVRLCDAAELLPRELSTAYTQDGLKGSPTAFSNIFRYRLLYERGGIWMDTDMLCLRPAEDYLALITKAGERILVAREDKQSVNNAVMMAAQPGSPVLAALLDTAEEKGFEIKVWGTLGPKLVTEMIRQRPEDFAILPESSFYPIYHGDFEHFLLPEYAEACAEACRGSYAMHLWNSILRRLCLPNQFLPPEGSFLHSQIQALLPEELPALPVETVLRLIEGTDAIRRLYSFKKSLATKLSVLVKEL